MQIDPEVFVERKSPTKAKHVISDIDTFLRLASNSIAVEDIPKIDPALYEACLAPTMKATSVMPASIYGEEEFKEFMDELIAYVEDPTPTKATWVKGLQRKYNIGVFMTDYPEQFNYRVHITLTATDSRWIIAQWDEMVPYDTAEIIMKAVDYL